MVRFRGHEVAAETTEPSSNRRKYEVQVVTVDTVLKYSEVRARFTVDVTD